MINEGARLRIEAIDKDIDKLQTEREAILTTEDLTTKEHYEYYHG